MPVTQQFNTTTSMERRTFNVLLSFAQFEREVSRTVSINYSDAETLNENLKDLRA